MVIVAQFYTFVPGTPAQPPPEGTFWLGLPITLQATQFKAAAIRSQINCKGIFVPQNIPLKVLIRKKWGEFTP